MIAEAGNQVNIREPIVGQFESIRSSSLGKSSRIARGTSGILPALRLWMPPT
jgi:hypothetical protein